MKNKNPPISEGTLRKLALEHPFYVIAEMYDCDPRWISELARNYKIHPTFKSQPETAEELDKIETMAIAGWTTRGIAEALGRSERFVKDRILPEFRYKLRQKGKCANTGWPEPNTNEWEALRGRTYEDMPKEVIHREWPYGPVDARHFTRRLDPSLGLTGSSMGWAG